ncbi:metal ABC transporter ATP-binding protein [Georgenia sp. TF02-10]|uniref:metal ABC transporter ATP-binding protein n=1 Tax=Georgenia sp. TF02-10 TaxID=2917725 RepID=UPI001FA7A5F5|nr:metal ABC transporter ATP-binding protein [Georgenia sp. TF02-10]UNX53529.1 metal ABC transporter ATP-binding protein [Georgenia sp. TF02-10]
MSAAPPVRARDLAVVLGGRTVLRGIDLTVGTGEMVALLGANGSGKSTLVRAVLGTLPAARGTVELFGADVRHRRQVPWQRVGYAPQRVTATAGVPATALEVVAAGLLDHRRLRPGAGWRDRAREALDEVGLADRAGESVQTFSGGQQQRVLIARALVRRPDLLVLDEPLAGIDRGSAEALAATLTGLRERGTTLLVVLHELGELAGLVQRAVVLRHGRVVHDGAPPAPAAGHAHPDHDHVHPHTSAVDLAHVAPDLSVEW